MATSAHERVIVRALREIAAERKLRFSSYSYNWVVRLERRGKARHVYGYNFEINSATASLLAQDKSALAGLLGVGDIPHVDHEFFLHPHLSKFVPDEGNWGRADAYASRHGYDVVCKPNTGTGGVRVYRVRSRRELEDAFQKLLQAGFGMCISPYVRIDHEYRLILLAGQCLLSYQKQLPAITGDGSTTVGNLLLDAANSGHIRPSVATRALVDSGLDPAHVLDPGETAKVSWKHNLGQGSSPQPIADEGLLSVLQNLALRGVSACNADFASVDIVETSGELRILEINSGVMMERFADLAPNGFQEAKAVYGRAVDMMFAD